MEPEITEFEKNVKYAESLGWKIKNLNTSELKDPILQVKDFDLNKNEVAFYFSAFNNKDSDGDVIKPGAFKKTFTEQKGRIKYLYNHNTTQSPGVIKELGEDSHGAYAVCTFYELPEPTGPAVKEMYKKGGITEHSMGYRAAREGYDKMEDANIITEIKLWEVSSLTAWGANMNTPMIGVKNLSDTRKRVEAILNDPNITEEKYLQLEQYLKTLTKPIQKAEFNYGSILKDLKLS